MSFRRSEGGFTLIELIMTIVLIGIIGVGTFQFIGSTTQGVIDAAERQQVATVGWIVSEKVSRELRDALPNSIRTNGAGSCVEFVPTKAGSDYLAAPVSPASATSFEIVPFPNYADADVDSAEDRIAIYPSDTASIYSLPSTGAVSGFIDQITAGTTLNAVTVELLASHTFETDSPNRRVFVAGNPVRFCFESNLLNRYSDYGYQANVETSISGSATSVVIGTDLSNGSFDYSPGTLTRTGVVLMAFDVVGGSGATQPINQEVQLRNVP